MVKLNAQGFPVLSQDSNGKSHLVLDPVSLVNPAVIQTLYNSADRYLRLQIRSQAAQARALAEHKRLFGYFKAGDAAGASKLLKRHIVDASDEIVAQLKRIMPAGGDS